MAKKDTGNIDESLLQQMIAGNLPINDEITEANDNRLLTDNVQDYENLFLERHIIQNRHSVYISQINYDEMFKTVRLLGNGLTVSCLIDNILTYHLKYHRDSINSIRQKLLEKLNL